MKTKREMLEYIVEHSGCDGIRCLYCPYYLREGVCPDSTTAKAVLRMFPEKKNPILEAQIAEAKDLIRNLLRVTYGEGWNYSLDWKVKAEQFLKE